MIALYVSIIGQYNILKNKSTTQYRGVSDYR